MKNKSKLKQVLSSIILLSFLWILFFISKFTFEEEEKNNNLNYIPSDAEVAVRINSNELIKSSLFSILFEAKDEKTIQKIKAFLQQKKTKGGGIKRSDLNLFSDIIIFSTPCKNGKMIGISFNLQDGNNFEENMTPLLGTNQAVKTIDNVGFILTYVNDSNTELSSSELISFFNNTIKKKSVLVVNKNSVFQIQTTGAVFGKSTYFSTSDLQINLLKSGIELDGVFSISAKEETNFTPSPLLLNSSKQDFHFSTSIIPIEFQDSIAKLLKYIDCSLPKIKSIAFNYQGMTIKKDNAGMHPIPEINLLLEFKSPFSIETFLKTSAFLEKIGAIYTNNELKIAQETYFINQINATTISIGKTKNLRLVKNKSNELFSSKGNLSSLLKIEGGGIIVSFLEITPLFHSSFELFNALDGFDVSICKTSNNQAKLKGNIVTKNGHSTINEAIKFLFGIRAIQ
jgi:hypothetical protein